MVSQNIRSEFELAVRALDIQEDELSQREKNLTADYAKRFADSAKQVRQLSEKAAFLQSQLNDANAKLDHALQRLKKYQM